MRRREKPRKATQRLHDPGQSLWLDNITRGLLTRGILRHYITGLSVTGLTPNPTIFDRAIKHTDCYNDAINDALAAAPQRSRLASNTNLEEKL
jgi:transaldolase